MMPSAPRLGCACGARRGFLQALVATGAVAALPVMAQVDVGKSSAMRNLVPAETLEQAFRTIERLDAGGRQKVVLLENDLPDNS